ncbi:MAG: ATP-binding protein [Flavobacteriales bacterium]|nr:ATP-binding protein [Flavobacteriales bacterium]
MLRVVITGPESSGKSVLAGELAAYFGAPLVPEYARTYLEQRPGAYVQADLLAIAQGQVAAERAAITQADDLFICDTDLLTIRIWSLEKFGTCDPWIDHHLEATVESLWLLCSPDLPWQPDPLRENPHDRDRLFDRYRTELEIRGCPVVVIHGVGPDRLRRAVDGIRLFSARSSARSAPDRARPL